MLLSQLFGQMPTLLVYLGGIVLCAVWSRRAPRAAMLAMIGCGVLLLTSIAVAFVTNYYIMNRGGPTPAATMGQIMVAVAIVGSVLRAAGFAMVLGAVFVGRPQVAQQSGFEVPPAAR
jgi:uncharacterized protein YqgC (DUF456 family)